MATKKQKQLSDEEKKELETLKARLAELEPWQPLEEEAPKKEPERKKTQLDDYVPVMSLIPWRLNLSTREGGQGDIKKFTRFGEVKNILYRDLVDIAEVHRSFMDHGYFYILNPDVVRQLGLDEVYSKILTKEKIEDILNNADSEHCVELYNSTNPEQQRVIVQLFIDKMKKDPSSVNLYTVDRISRISNINISQRAEDEKAIEEELTEQLKQ